MSKQQFLSTEKALFDKLDILTEKAARRLVTAPDDRDDFELYKKRALALKALVDELSKLSHLNNATYKKRQEKFNTYVLAKSALLGVKFSSSCFDSDLESIITLQGIKFDKVLLRALEIDPNRASQSALEQLEKLRNAARWRTDPYRIIRAYPYRNYYKLLVSAKRQKNRYKIRAEFLVKFSPFYFLCTCN